MVGTVSVHRFSTTLFTVFVVFWVNLPDLVTSGGSVKCPSSAEDIKDQANSCFRDYKAFEDSHQLTGSHLFTNVDVEIIRTLCSNLKSSMRCLKTLKDRCPMDQHHNKIESAVTPYVPVVELCDHQRLYEEYAMNQNCLHGQKDHSEHCYRTFRTDAEVIKSTEHYYVQQYCGLLGDLTTCLRSNFAVTCRELSGLLLELLVKAAIGDSYRCRSGDKQDATVVTVTPQKSSRLGSHRRSNSAHHLPTSIQKRIVFMALYVSTAFILSQKLCFGN